MGLPGVPGWNGAGRSATVVRDMAGSIGAIAAATTRTHEAATSLSVKAHELDEVVATVGG